MENFNSIRNLNKTSKYSYTWQKRYKIGKVLVTKGTFSVNLLAAHRAELNLVASIQLEDLALLRKMFITSLHYPAAKLWASVQDTSQLSRSSVRITAGSSPNLYLILFIHTIHLAPFVVRHLMLSVCSPHRPVETDGMRTRRHPLVHSNQY